MPSLYLKAIIYGYLKKNRIYSNYKFSFFLFYISHEPVRKENARQSYHMSISNTSYFKMCFVHPSGRWEIKCTCKKTEMIHRIMIAFHQLHQLYTALRLGEIYLQLVKNTP